MVEFGRFVEDLEIVHVMEGEGMNDLDSNLTHHIVSIMWQSLRLFPFSGHLVRKESKTKLLSELFSNEYQKPFGRRT